MFTAKEIAEKEIANIKRKNAFVWLKITFPKTFLEDPLPLKIGIHQDILNLEFRDKPSKKCIRSALSYYVNWYKYLYSLKAETPRYDLNGEPCGFVTIEEEQAAKAKNIKRKQQYFSDLKERKKISPQNGKNSPVKKSSSIASSEPPAIINNPINDLPPKKFKTILTLKK